MTRCDLSGAAVDAVVFDLDGTLVDSLPGIEFSLRAALDEILPGTPLHSARSLIGPPVREMFRRIVPDTHEHALGELESAFRRSYDETGFRKTILYPGVRETLDALRAAAVRCYIVTNKPPEATRRVLAHLGLGGDFLRVVSTGDRLPERITKAEATRILLDAEGVPGCRCVFVGDSPDDAEAARANAMAFAAATYGYGGVLPQPGDGAIAALEDLIGLIQKTADAAHGSVCVGSRHDS